MKRAIEPSSSISTEEVTFFREFLDYQKQNLAVQQEENQIQRLRVDNESHQLSNAHDFALKNLDAIKEDRKHARDSGRTRRRDRLAFAAGIIVVLLIFVCYALYLNKDTIALEVLKYVGTALVSGLGGYALREHQVRENKREDRSETSSKD